MEQDILIDMKNNRLIYNFKRLPIKHKHIPNNFYGKNIINLLKDYDKDQNEDVFLSIVSFYFHIKTEELSLYVDNMKICSKLAESFKSFIQREISKKLTSVNKTTFLLFLEEKHKDIIDKLKETLIRLIETHIYILELESSCYYVGLTNNIERRMKEHMTNHGSIFTREHQMLRKIGDVKCIDLIKLINLKCNKLISEYDCEELITICMINKYGISNVQGAQYTGIRSRRTFAEKISNINTEDILELFFTKNS